MHSLARNTSPRKSSKPQYFTRPRPQHPKSNLFLQIARNGQAPFICSLNRNFSKDQNQLDGCPTSEESHYKCKQYIAVYNCQNMLKSLSFIRSMFSSAKRSLTGSSALSPLVRNIVTTNYRVVEPFCFAKAIYQKDQQALMISIIKNGLLPLIVFKKLKDPRVKAPSTLPELKAIIGCLKMSKKLGMRDFVVYFQHGGIKRLSQCNIRNPTLLAQFQVIDRLLKQCNASLCHSPKFVNLRQEIKKHRSLSKAKKNNTS